MRRNLGRRVARVMAWICIAGGLATLGVASLRLWFRPHTSAARASRWLGDLPRNCPFFLWVHFYDPHAPYSPPPPWRDEYRERLYDGEIA